MECLESRVLLSGDAALVDTPDLGPVARDTAAICVQAGHRLPALPGLAPVGLAPEDLAGQVVVLDMDGAEGVVYNGPVQVGPFDVPGLALAGGLGGQGQAVADLILAGLTRTFAGSGLVFTAEEQGPGHAHSTVYITAGDSPFKVYGDFAGLAEQVDLGNACAQDRAVVFVDRLMAGPGDLDRVVEAIVRVAAHEIGHLVGYVHAADADLLRSGGVDPAGYGHLLSQVAHDAGVDNRYVTYAVVRAQLEAKDTYVHQWIAQQAVAFYQSQFAGGEIAAYLGTVPDSNDEAWYPVDTTHWSQFTGDDLLEGVYEEDTLGIWMRHFVAGGDGPEMTMGLDKVPADDDLILETLLKGAVTEFITDPEDGRYWSAYEAAEPLWQQALDSYRQGDKALGYYHLGRVAHLVADMTVPAHVHLDRHAALQDDGDFYEKTTSVSTRFLSWGVEAQRGGPVGPVRDYASLPDLLTATVDYTEEYPSWNQAGVLQVAGDDEAGIPNTGRHRPDLVSVLDGWDMDDYWVLADDLMPWAMEQTAALLRLFYRQVDAAGPTVEWVTAFGPSQAEASSQSARLLAEVRAADGVSGYQAEGFRFVIETQVDGDWSVYHEADPHSGILRLRLAENGLYRIQATVADAAGHAGSTGYGYFLVEDALTCPPLVTVDRITTPDTTPALHGTVDDPGAEVSVDVGGQTYEAVNNGDGTWVLPDDTISPPLVYGTHDVKATATDGLGNVGTDDTADELIVRFFEEDFSTGDLSRWTIVDQGRWFGPSRWSALGGELTQASNVCGIGGPGAIARLGTFALYRDGDAWTDYDLTLTLRSQDNDDLGVLFRVQDTRTYYRFSWNRQDRYRRLVRCQDGQFTELARDAVPYEKGREYQVSITAHGPLLEVRVDGQEVFSVVDTALSRGTIGLYSCANQGSLFDDIVVQGLVGVNSPPRISAAGAGADLITDAQTAQLQVVAQDYDQGPSALSYLWTSSGGLGAFDDPTLPNPTYTPPDVTAPQTLSLTVTVRDGEASVQGTVDLLVTDADAQVLLADDFGDGLFDGWSVVQEGLWLGPARWSAAGCEMAEGSGVRRPLDGVARRGTFAMAEAGESWADYEVRLSLRSDDTGDLGVMFRVQDPRNYYRFSWNSRSGYARLVRCTAGRFDALASTPLRYVMGRTYAVSVLARGTALRVYVDGRLLLSAEDGRLGSGGIALYSSGNRGSVFDDIVVGTA